MVFTEQQVRGNCFLKVPTIQWNCHYQFLNIKKIKHLAANMQLSNFHPITKTESNVCKYYYCQVLHAWSMLKIIVVGGHHCQIFLGNDIGFKSWNAVFLKNFKLEKAWKFYCFRGLCQTKKIQNFCGISLAFTWALPPDPQLHFAIITENLTNLTPFCFYNH